MNKIKLNILISIIALLQGCASAASHRDAIRDDAGSKITVGKAQSEIRVGMSGADVAGVLGSPNIVTTDEERREVWIYDKFSTESIYSTSSGGVSALILTGIGNVLAGAAPSTSRSSGAASRTQRTLTIIIKFDNEKKVRDLAYHSSSF